MQIVKIISFLSVLVCLIAFACNKSPTNSTAQAQPLHIVSITNKPDTLGTGWDTVICRKGGGSAAESVTVSWALNTAVTSSALLNSQGDTVFVQPAPCCFIDPYVFSLICTVAGNKGDTIVDTVNMPLQH